MSAVSSMRPDYSRIRYFVGLIWGNSRHNYWFSNKKKYDQNQYVLYVAGCEK